MTVVSVVMSTYKDAAYLAESINSVLTQGFTNFEFIIVNDGCPDPRTGKVLSAYEQLDPRIRVINKENEGLTKALITGCANAKGKYIARIDVGDVMTPDRLRRQASLLDELQDVTLITCWSEYGGPKWEHLYTVEGRGPDEVEKSRDCWVVDATPRNRQDNLRAGPSHHGSAMFRASAYRDAGGYRWQFYYGQDWDLWYRLAERGRFAGVNDILYRVRLLPDGISGSHAQHQKQLGRCSLDAFWCRHDGLSDDQPLARAAVIRPNGQTSTNRQTRKGSGAFLIGRLLQGRGDGDCVTYLKQAVEGSPLNIYYRFRYLQSLFSFGRHPCIHSR